MGTGDGPERVDHHRDDEAESQADEPQTGVRQLTPAGGERCHHRPGAEEDEQSCADDFGQEATHQYCLHVEHFPTSGDHAR